MRVRRLGSAGSLEERDGSPEGRGGLWWEQSGNEKLGGSGDNDPERWEGSRGGAGGGERERQRQRQGAPGEGGGKGRLGGGGWFIQRGWGWRSGPVGGAGGWTLQHQQW